MLDQFDAAYRYYYHIAGHFRASFLGGYCCSGVNFVCYLPSPLDIDLSKLMPVFSQTLSITRTEAHVQAPHQSNGLD